MESSSFYFILLVALVVSLILVVVARPEKIYEFPFFIGAVFFSFVLPQAFSLIRFPGDASSNAVASVLLMAFLSLLMCCLGYARRGNYSMPKLLIIKVDDSRLAHGGLLFTFIACVFTLIISGMTDEETGGSLWTGRVTIYAFFAHLIYPGFAILLLTALKTRSLAWWSSAILAAAPPLYATIFGGRRETTVLFLLTIALTLFFHKRVRLKRWMVCVAILLAAVAIPATGTYRSIAAQGEWHLLKEFSLVENFKFWISEEQRVLELRNAAMIMEVVGDTANYSFGVGYWDELIWRFVPAQLLGAEFKEGLMIRRSDESMENELFNRGYQISTGSTVTGIGDAFCQFGYFGALFFALVGWLFRWLWMAAVEHNSTIAQIFYIQISTTAMRAVTHQTVDFLPGVTYHLLFLGALVLYARVGPRSRRDNKANFKNSHQGLPVTSKL